VIGLSAGLPQCPQRLDGGFELVQPLGGRRELQPERRVLAVPPARADAAERAAAGEHVERGDRLRQDPRRAKRDRGDQRAQAQARRDAGQQAERHPRLGDRLPRPARLRDLDEVIHQRDPAEAGGGRRASDGGKPAGRVVLPREPGDLQDELQPGRAQILLGGGAAASRGMRGLDARVCGPQDQIPALGPDLAGHRGDPP